MKRSILFLATALVASVFSLGAAGADHFPARANIEDPRGDANGLNDQGLAAITGFQGNNRGGFSHAPADIRKVWFSNTAGSVTVHVLTSEPPTASDTATHFAIDVNNGCLLFEAIIPGANYDGKSEATVRTPPSEECGGTFPIPGMLNVTETFEGLGLTTLTFGMYSHNSLVPGHIFAAPKATSSLITGSKEDGSLTGPQIDNTKEGLAYRIQQPPPSTVDEPQTEAEKPDKAKKANKGKKKGHAKHGCDHPGKGHGHEGDCPEEDD